MSTQIPDILARIVATKRDEVAAKTKLRKGMEQNARFQAGQRRGFRAGLVKKSPATVSYTHLTLPTNREV